MHSCSEFSVHKWSYTGSLMLHRRSRRIRCHSTPVQLSFWFPHKALEAACWIPILKGSRLVLAGDHKQLAPTVKSQDAEAGLLDGDRRDSHGSNGGDGLGFTMFDRILRDHGPQVCRMLEVQYRMNENICGWASKEASDVEIITRGRSRRSYMHLVKCLCNSAAEARRDASSPPSSLW